MALKVRPEQLGVTTGLKSEEIMHSSQTLSGNELMPTASVELEVEGERRSASGVGNGPLDAALKAVDAATDTLKAYLSAVEATRRAEEVA